MEKLYIVCILYNRTIEEISSLDVFLDLADRYDLVKLMIMDNSSEAFAARNREVCETIYRNRITYTYNGGNIGLSKAYNKALGMIKDDSFFTMWTDDDTVFSKKYLENVIKAIKLGKGDIIGGIIKTQDKIISPLKQLSPLFVDAMYIKKEGTYENIYCINTGLAVKSTVFDAVGRYDERLFLDAVDHLFCDRLTDKGLNRIIIVPGDITQDYSMQTNDLSARRKRHKIFVRDWLKTRSSFPASWKQ